jgi:hypothetical protein
VSTYCILEATVPLQRYVATVTLKRVTDGDRTFWHWESTFATPPGRERELREMVASGVYEAGFENLRRHLHAGADLNGGTHGDAARPTGAAIASRCIAVSAYGGPEVLRIEAGEASAPAAGEVRIRQRAIGVNYFDIYLRRGWIPGMLPLGGSRAVLGMEAAGTVIDVGPGTSGLLPGDRVAYLCPQPGAYSSVRTVPAAWVGAPAGGGRGRHRRSDAAEGPHRRRAAARRRPRRCRHAPARPCRGRRPRPARLQLGRQPRRDGGRHRLVGSQGPRRP